jgi:hypothetical protein
VWLFVSVAAIGLLLVSVSAQSLTYSRGQNVSPAYEGWDKNSDGTFNLLFGYMNNNWEQQLDVPVGPQNGFSPLAADQGQPTHFLPRRNRFVFKVRVPKDFGDKELVWTLTTNGVTEKAYASLRPDYFIDDIVIASETGSLGAGLSNPTIRANTPPAIKLEGTRTRTVKVGEPVTLVAWVTDDGVPRVASQRGGQRPTAETIAKRAMSPPQRPTPGKTNGLYLSWFVYRGNGAAATFEPEQTKVWEDTRTGANSPWAPLWVPPVLPADDKWTTQATFSEPGPYVLRARADDGALLADEQVTITVVR